MDDVILDFVGGLRAAIKKEYDVEISEDDINKWDLAPILNPVVGYSWWKWLRERDWLWANFPAVNGAIGSIERLSHEGHYLEVVTSKPDWATYAVWKWLGRWRPRVNRVTIIGPDDKKIDFTDASLLVDDKTDNCIQFVEAGRNAILFDRPHNRHNTELIRATNWKDVMDVIHQLA